MSQLTQGFRFDLPNPLSGYIKLLTHLFQSMVSIHIDPKPHSEHFGFSRRQACQDITRGIPQAFFCGNIQRRAHSGGVTIGILTQEVP